MGSIVPASPAAITAFITLWAIQGSLLSMPSTMKKLSWGRPPLVLLLHPEPPGYLVTPGRSSSRFSKFRPFRGKSLMTLFSMRSAQFGIRSIDCGRGRGDFDLLADFAGLEHQVRAEILSDFQLDGGLLTYLEARDLRANALVAGNQAGSVVFSGSIGGKSALDASVDVDDRHGHAGYRRAGLIGHCSLDAA